ncbi:MAG TPA: hypothetical protein VMP01_05570 [Pirellulaceae bacterium]|nr:hypothetical protein [Pirellulaceae bacterium]
MGKDGGVVLVYEVAEKSDATPATVAASVRQRLDQLVPRGQLQVPPRK